MCTQQQNGERDFCKGGRQGEPKQKHSELTSQTTFICYYTSLVASSSIFATAIPMAAIHIAIIRTVLLNKEHENVFTWDVSISETSVLHTRISEIYTNDA